MQEKESAHWTDNMCRTTIRCNCKVCNKSFVVSLPGILADFAQAVHYIWLYFHVAFHHPKHYLKFVLLHKETVKMLLWVLFILLLGALKLVWMLLWPIGKLFAIFYA